MTPVPRHAPGLNQHLVARTPRLLYETIFQRSPSVPQKITSSRTKDEPSAPQSVSGIFRYFVDILKMAFQNLKPFFAWLVSLAIVALLGFIAWVYCSSLIAKAQHALLCDIPLVKLYTCPNEPVEGIFPPAFSGSLTQQSPVMQNPTHPALPFDALTNALHGLTHTSQLSKDIYKLELSIRNTLPRVRQSGTPPSYGVCASVEHLLRGLPEVLEDLVSLQATIDGAIDE